MSKKATFGLEENIASLCCYAGLFVTGIIFLIFERENKTVRFHALQSTIWFGALSLVSAVLGWIPFLGALVNWILGLVIFASWVALILSALSGKTFKIPILGDIVYDTVNR